MAVTKILNIGDCGTGYHGKHLKAAIDYIKASEKTDGGRLVGGINCQPDFAYDRMKSTKVKFGKTDKRQAYHFIISFEEGEVDDDTAFEITQRFAKEYIGNEYEVVFSVHNNTDHKHGHIIFNSVNMVNGKKYRYEKGDWAKYIQPLTNRLCEEYGLSTIDISADGKGINERYKDWNPYRDGKFIWKDMVMRDVDSCIVQASTYDSFLELMEEKGYTIKQGKHMAVMMPGMKRYMRIDTWGSEYTKERITERIREESIADYKPQKERSQPKIVYCKFTRYKRAKLTGLQKKYFAKLYRTGKLKKRSYSQAWKYRDDIKKMHKLHAQYTFLSKYGIKDINIDLMFSLPKQTMEDLFDSMKKVVGYNISHVSCYSLILEQKTKLYNQVRDKKVTLPSNETEEKMYDEVINFLTANGYNQYEISNFARPGHESVHNSSYWENIEYYGLGAGAHGYIDGVRYANQGALKFYIDSMLEKGHARREEHTVTDKEKIEEEMFLGLRLLKGVDLNTFEEKYGKRAEKIFKEVIDKNLKIGYLEIDDNKLRLTRKGLFYGNEVFSEFLLD